jgi:NTE family protein
MRCFARGIHRVGRLIAGVERGGPGLAVALSMVLFAVPATTTVLAQSTDSGQRAATATSGQRPRVGLVLAGGGAKGGAHVGVLKVLEEMHVPIDCIAGTSMGALVGGGYASGISAADMDKFLRGVNWQRVLGGLGARDREPIEQKRRGVTYSNSLQLGIRRSRVIVAPGLVNTSAIDDLLRGFVAKARAQTDFDRLPIPYRAVATDMVSGRMVVLSHGDLATAMRASMAVPGAFAPVEIGDEILSDGGIVRNIPVDVARTLCGDVLIVVNLVVPPVKREQLQSAPRLLGRMTDLMFEANERQQLDSLTARDVRIDVEMGDISSIDFQRTSDTIALGEAAARRAAPQLTRLSVSPAAYLAWRSKVNSEQGIKTKIGEVQFAQVPRVNPQYLDQVAGIKSGGTVTTEQISEGVERMAALQDIASVSYELKGDPGNTTLEWLPTVKSWGPNYLKIDLGLYSDTSGDDRGFALYLAHERNWINRLGGQWRNELQLGTVQFLATSFYQPLDVAQRFFVEPKIFWNRDWENVFYYGAEIARYRFADRGGGLDFGVNVSNQAQLRVGYLSTQREVILVTGSPLLPQLQAKDAGIVASAVYDSRDASARPTRGFVAAVEYYKSDEQLGAERSWQRLESGFGFAVPLGKNVFWMALAGGSGLGSKLPEDRLFALGGPGSFPGYQLAEIRAAEYWSLTGVYLWQLADLFSVLGQALYAGVRLQTGHTYSVLGGESIGQIGSISLYVTGRTPVGPVTVGLATTNTSKHALWFSVGRPVWEGSILDRGLFR